ncbi:hypothetical protein [Nonomuraea monospora]
MTAPARPDSSPSATTAQETRAMTAPAHPDSSPSATTAQET